MHGIDVVHILSQTMVVFVYFWPPGGLRAPALKEGVQLICLGHTLCSVGEKTISQPVLYPSLIPGNSREGIFKV